MILGEACVVSQPQPFFSWLVLPVSARTRDETDAPAKREAEGLSATSVKPGLHLPEIEHQRAAAGEPRHHVSRSRIISAGESRSGPIVLSPRCPSVACLLLLDAGERNDGERSSHARAALRACGMSPAPTLAVLGEVEAHLPLRWDLSSTARRLAAGRARSFFGSNQQGGVFSRPGGGLMVYPRAWIGIGVQGDVSFAMSKRQRADRMTVCRALEMNVARSSFQVLGRTR